MPTFLALFLPLALALVLNAPTLHAQTWSQTTDFPGTARDDGSTFTVGSTAYFGTGLEVGWQPTRDFYSYSFAEGWSAVASLPEGTERQYACGCADDTFGYLFGGVGNNSAYYNDLWRYDPNADAWVAMTPLPGPGRSGAACFGMGGQLFFVGGRFADGNYTAETWTYLPASDAWEQLDDYPAGAVWRMQAGVQGAPGDQSAMVGTGLREDGIFHGGVYAFLEATNGWSSSLGSLPGGGRMYASMGRWQGKAALFGGEDTEGNFLNDLWQWEWNGLLWEELTPLPSFGRRGGMMATLGGDLIYTTGLNADLERIQETWTTALGVNVENSDSRKGITLYPNPGHDELRMAGDLTGAVDLRFYSLDGKLGYTARIDFSEAVAVGHLPKGMYIVEIITTEGAVDRRKWVRE